MTTSVVVERLRAGHAVTVRLWGRSMSPTVRPGARLSFVPCAIHEASVGDVLLVVRGDALVAHRAIEVGPQGARTWGDGLLAPDPRCSPDELLGRAPGVPLGAVQLPVAPALARPTNAALGAIARRITAARARLVRSSARGSLIALLDAARGVRRMLSPFEIVPLDASWRGRLAELELRASRRATKEALARWRAALDGTGAAWLAVSRRREPVGWMLAVVADDGVASLRLWVEPMHRRMGIATALSDRMRRTATERGWTRLNDTPLGVEPSDER